MNTLRVESSAFRQYGDVAATMATTVATAGAIDQAASVAAAVPTFGLIGQEFLAAFAYAQANHFTAVNQLAGAFANTSAAAHIAADAFTRTEQHSADGFTIARSAER